ncbi:MAG: hypothetical protein ACKOBC_06385 [Hyphomicrobiales bacterium]
MDTPYIDFSKPMTFQNALQHFALALAFVMVALRDEAAFRDEPDQASLNAAHLFCSMVEDALTDAEAVVERMEGLASKSRSP